jgi:hypothetical protein
MRNWDKNLLNEKMFEYYEGTLSSEKSIELLELVNQNQELEAEFSQWAQTYTLKHAELKDYGIQARLIRNESFWFRNFQWYALLVFLVGMGYLIWNYQPQQKNETPSALKYKQRLISGFDKNKNTIKLENEFLGKSKKTFAPRANKPADTSNKLQIQQEIVDLPVVISDEPPKNDSPPSHGLEENVESKKPANEVSSNTTSEFNKIKKPSSDLKNQKNSKVNKRRALKVIPNQNGILPTNPNF